MAILPGCWPRPDSTPIIATMALPGLLGGGTLWECRSRPLLSVPSTLIGAVGDRPAG